MKKKLFKTVLNEYLKEAQQLLKPSTYSCFLLIGENHLKKYFANKWVYELNESEIQRYILYLCKKGRLDNSGGLSVKTVRDIVLVLRQTLNYAYHNNMINPINWEVIKYPKEDNNKVINCLSKEEELELIQSIYLDLNRKTVGILLSLVLGLRIGELCGLKINDISIEERTITINRTVQRIYNKKTGKSRIMVGTPKTKSSVRIIPLPSMLVKILDEYTTGDSDNYFLTGKRKPSEPRTMRAFFKRFLKKQNLRQIKFHELRHTFAVRAIEIPDFDIKSLSEILGHKNVSFTLNVYGSANMQQKVKCMNLLNDLL